MLHVENDYVLTVTKAFQTSNTFQDKLNTN